MGGEVTVLEAEPRPAPADPRDDAAAVTPDAGAPLDPDDLGSGAPNPLGADVALAACVISEQGCTRLYISVADAEAETCLQLSLDDCNDTTRPGLSVDVPLSWRFAAAFVGDLEEECIPNTPFDENDSTIVSGSGGISWNRDSRRPSEISIDVTLQPSIGARVSDPIRVSNSDLVEVTAECDD